MLKKDILRKKDDFTGIYKKGKSIGERYIVFFYRKIIFLITGQHF